jgi:hypothetical protein
MKRYIKSSNSYGKRSFPEYPVKDSNEYSSYCSKSLYWYRTNHGVGPGSVPQGLNIYDVIDNGYGRCWFLTDQVLTTDALKRYDIYEETPPAELLEESGY